MLHQDNARPPVSLTTRQELPQLGWGVLLPPTLLVYNLYIIINNITHRILFSDNMGTMSITKEFDRPNSLVTPNNK